MTPVHIYRNIILTGVVPLLLLYSCQQAAEKPTPAVAAVYTIKDTSAISSLIKKANSYTQTNFDSMRYYAVQAEEIARAIPFPEGIGRARGIQANYLRRKGDYEGAVTIGLEVIHVFDSLKLWVRLVKMQNFLADVYKEMGGEKGTAEYLEKGLELAKAAQVLSEKENYNAGIVMSLNEQGIILRDMHDRTGRKELMDSAFHLYNKAVDIIKSTGDGAEDLVKLYNNISQVYNEHYLDYDKALQYQEMAVAINTKENNRASLTYNYNTIAEIYMNRGQLDKAGEYAHKMLALCRDLGSPFRIVNAYGVLTDYNKKAGRYDSALHYNILRNSLSDSINNLEKSNQIAAVQTKFETAKKEEQISYLAGLNKNKTQRLIILTGAAGLLLVLLSVVWMQKRRSQQQQQQIRQQSDKLQWMMKELHHRVKNNLQIVSSLLNLQSYRMKDEESVSAIRESQLRVQAMSLMHQRLYQVEDVSMVNFKLYLTDLAETLMRAYGYGPDNFDLQINIEKEMLDVDTVMPMGLLVNEIITNSFKYAYEKVTHPVLTISMKEKDQQLQLQIADNGPGMNTGEIKQGGFGQKLITALTKQLKATCTVNTEQGTSYTLLIPYQKEKAA